MSTRPWYRVEAKAGEATAHIYVYDEIGKSFWNDDAVTAQKFIADLKALPESTKTIQVHVNSPGGSVFEAVAIANALKAQRDTHGRAVEMSIEGIAASAATIITSAGSPIRIADNAMMMIHEPLAIEAGNAGAMRKMAELLDRVRDSIVATYRWVSSKTTEELSAMMAETTWMNAQEAVENGFATEVVAGAKVEACFRPDVIARIGEVPGPYKPKVEALVKQPATQEQPPAAAALDIVKACKAAGCSELAEDLIAAGVTAEQLTAKVGAAKDVKAKATQQSTDITAICASAKLPELAAGLVAGGMTIEGVKAHLAIVTAKVDGNPKNEIDGSLKPDSPAANGGSANTIDRAAIFEARKPKTAKE